MTLLGNPPNHGGSLSNLASSSLPSLGGDPLTRPSWKRSLQELAASNLATMGSNGASSNPPSAAAQMLLGSKTDFGSLLRNQKKTKSQQHAGIRASMPSSNRFSYDALQRGGIEAVVRKHRDGILERILKEEREQTQRLLEKAVEKQVEDDWKEERQWWRNELVGDRNLVDVDRHKGDSRNQQGGTKYTVSSSSTQGLLVADYRSQKQQQQQQNVFATGCDPKMMQDHLQIIQQLCSSPTRDPLRIIDAFEQISGGNDPSFAGYKTTWTLLKCMLHPNLQASKAIGRAQGAQSFICKQYQTLINSYVKSAALSGQDISTPIQYGSSGSMAETIAAYVKLISGSHSSVWEILYYCLRSGDAHAAKDVLNATPSGREEFAEQPIVSAIVRQLSQRQGNASCMFEVGSPMIGSDHRSTISDMYERTKNLEPNHTHKLSVLALLCGKQLETFSSVEDYLFGCLWLALMDRENPVGQIEQIGASVQKYGASHFCADGLGEWNYVLPLIASQQFATALEYLAGEGGPNGLMQATHLGIVFAVANVDVTDLSSAGPSRDVVTALLVNYAALTEREPSARVLSALEYLLQIPNEEESNYQIANLIHRSPPDQIEILGGVLDAVGNRKDGELDKRMPTQKVSFILQTAAELFKKQGKSSSDRSKTDWSAKLFMLAYSHSKLVQLLNEQLAPVNQMDENATYWMQQSELFYNAYLSKRTNVLDSIERDGKLSLIDTNRCLLELRSFFDLYRQRKFEEAFAKVGATQLVPLSQDDLNSKSSKFSDLDPILKEEFPAVLVAAVECVCEVFHSLKSKSQKTPNGGLPPVVVDRLKELQFLARYLFLYAGLIHMPSGCKNDIARMRANMIL